MRTYVIRLQEPRPGDGGELHGVAEEIATGRQVRFANGSQLLEIFASNGDPVDAGSPGGLGSDRSGAME